MNRQTLAIQAQANKYIELEKLGFNADQRTEFKDWLNACEAHQTAYQESKHVDALLAQFNESELTTESTIPTPLKPQSEHTRTTERTVWLKNYRAIAACCALLMISVLSYHFVPNMFSQQPFVAEHQSTRGDLLEYTLPDNSHITLDAKTQLSLAFNDKQRLSQLTSGRVLFDVESDKARPFVVNAGTTKITVLGTRFSVDKKANQVRVAVAHGKVAVQMNEHNVVLNQGEVALINGNSIKRDAMAHANVGAWQQGRLVFNNEPLLNAFHTFKRYHNRDVIFTDAHAEQLRLSGVFSASELDGFVNLLPHALPVEAKIINNQIVISSKK